MFFTTLYRAALTLLLQMLRIFSPPPPSVFRHERRIVGGQQQMHLVLDSEPPCFKRSPIRTSPQIINALLIDERNACVMESTASLERRQIQEQGANSFVISALHAHANKQGWQLRADDVWLAILVQLSAAHPRVAGRPAVVLSGRTVEEGEFTGLLCDLFTQTAMQRIPTDPSVGIAMLHRWSTPRFSTSSLHDTLASNIAYLGSPKPYSAGTATADPAGCIRQIALIGVESDWLDLYLKVVETKELFIDSDGLHGWIDRLTSICLQFARSAGGQVTYSFWQKACKVDRVGTDLHLSGWLVEFCGASGGKSINACGSKSINIADIPTGVCELAFDTMDIHGRHPCRATAGHRFVRARSPTVVGAEIDIAVWMVWEETN